MSNYFPVPAPAKPPCDLRAKLCAHGPDGAAPSGRCPRQRLAGGGAGEQFSLWRDALATSSWPVALDAGRLTRGLTP